MKKDLDLDLDTQYRFAEIEVRSINNFIRHWGVIPDHILAHRLDVKGVEKPLLYDIINRDHPTRKEWIFYLRYHNVSYQKIVKQVGVSPNTILHYKDKPIELKPKFPHWTPERLERWNNFKNTQPALAQPLLDAFQQEKLTPKEFDYFIPKDF